MDIKNENRFVRMSMQNRFLDKDGVGKTELHHSVAASNYVNNDIWKQASGPYSISSTVNICNDMI